MFWGILGPFQKTVIAEHKIPRVGWPNQKGKTTPYYPGQSNRKVRIGQIITAVSTI